MKVHYHQCQRPNIGDDINRWFWGEVLGSALSHQPDTLLVGIGTVLNDMLPPSAQYLVIGSGAGYGDALPSTNSSWRFVCVRGPMTADALGLDRELVITDPGLLMPILRAQTSERKGIAFMPHIGIDSDAYRALIEDLGWTYISPSDDENQILAGIAGAEKLITSSLHGAIFADAYRTPWLGVSTSPEILPFKWHDWGKSMELDIELEQLPALWKTGERSPRKMISGIIKKRMLRDKLKKLAVNAKFFMSKEGIVEARQDALQDRLGKLRCELEQGLVV